MSLTILAVGLILTAAFAAALAFAVRSGKDPFSPWALVPALYLLRTSAYLLLLSTDPHRFSDSRIAEHFPNLDAAYLWYGVIELVGFCSLLFGLNSRVGLSLGEQIPLLQYKLQVHTCYVAAVAALGLGFLAYAMILSNVGGLNELLNSLDRRVELLEGLGYLVSATSLAGAGCVIMAYTLKFDRGPVALSIVTVSSLLTMAMYSSWGGRKLSLSLLASLLMVWHYGVQPIRRPLRLGLLLLALIAPYFIAMPLIRSHREGVAHYMANPDALLEESIENASTFVTQLSYCDTYAFVTNHFDLSNIWMGRSYLDLAKLPIPRRILPNKPPADEGVYIYALANGYQAEPGMPSDNLPGVGWPPETIGVSYANFHVPGVLAGMFLLGAVYRSAYVYLLRSNKSLFSVLIYQATLFGFHFANLRIVQWLMAATTLTIFFMTFMGGRLRR